MPLRKLAHGVSQLLEMRVVVRFEVAPPKGRHSIHLVPNTLGGAMWLQLAEAIAGDKSYRDCASCGRWFQLSPDVARTSRLYCSEACRSRAYRLRKQARALAADGHSPKRIAAELGTTVQTVRGWLTEKGGRS